MPNVPPAQQTPARAAIKNIASFKAKIAAQTVLARIKAAAQAVLHARALHIQPVDHKVGATLAQLYDPDLMPANLVQAHAALDKLVDSAYRPDGGAQRYADDAERVAFLFSRYAALTRLV